MIGRLPEAVFMQINRTKNNVLDIKYRFLKNKCFTLSEQFFFDIYLVQKMIFKADV